MGSSGNEILDMYIYETNTLLEQLETIVLEAEKADTFSQDDVNEIFRIMHTIKGSSAMMEYDSLATVSHRIEDLFFIIRENTMSVVSVEHRPRLFDLMFQSIDYFLSLIHIWCALIPKISYRRKARSALTQAANFHMAKVL